MEEKVLDSNRTDAELVQLTLQDKEFFKYLVERYEAKLLRYVRRLSNISLEEAQDILQEIFIKVYLNLNDFDQDLKFSSWIYRIAHNETINHFRHRQRRPVAVDLDSDKVFLGATRADLNLELELDRVYKIEEVQQALGRLESKYREVILFKYMDDKGYQEISDILKKPLGTVATLLNRAKQKLKQELSNNPKL